MLYSSLPYLRHTDLNQFFLLAGPCVVESEELVMQTAETIQKLTDQYEIPFVFKASYRKANRSKASSFTGIGDEKALRILHQVRETYKLPIVTDIHNAHEANMAAAFADILQIPAFLCRQTDILEAAGKTGKVVNIKKGQFLSPHAMAFSADKVAQTKNHKIMLTDRGTSFGYQDLIVDYRSIPIMQETGYPVILDITHSLQQPNQPAGVSGGQPEMIETIAKAGIAAGADGIFLETHPDPKNAKSDGANMLDIQYLDQLLDKLTRIRKAIL